MNIRCMYVQLGDSGAHLIIFLRIRLKNIKTKERLCYTITRYRRHAVTNVYVFTISHIKKFSVIFNS